MTEPTMLDTAHAEMVEEGEAARMAFFDRLVAAELFLLLDAEAGEETVRPRIFETEGHRFTLVFDTEERLAEFAGTQAPFVGLRGRALVEMLAGQGLGIALNPDVAPSAELLDADTVDWLSGVLSGAPVEVEARPEELLPPGDLPEGLLSALDARLAQAAGIAKAAWLVGVRYEGGARGHLLGVIDAVQGAEPGIARSVSEALALSGLEAASIDVAFFDATNPITARLEKVGLRFDLPQPAKPKVPGANPGMDPEKPPRLR